MENLNKIIAKIEQFAPLELAESWDNSGWQLYLGNKTINKIMLAVSPTIDVIEDAVNKGCDLLITHHPLIFSGIKSLSTDNYSDLPLIKAVQNNLQIYSAHTNLDVTKGGIADLLAEKIGLKGICHLNIPENGNFGRQGELKNSENLIELVDKIKKALDIDKLKLINPSEVQNIKTVAVVPGSGGSFIADLQDIDLYITGDIKYHDALTVKDFAVIDIGHLESEKIILEKLANLLKKLDAEIFIAEEKTPWELV